MFPERDCLLSGQKSSTSSRLLYDGLPSFLGSARSSTLRPIQLSKYKWKKRCFLAGSIRNSSSKKEKAINQNQGKNEFSNVNKIKYKYKVVVKK